MRNHDKRIRAAFTVEAAMLMAVILPVLMAVLITAMDLHDKALMRCAVSEAVGMGGNLVLYEQERAALPALIGKLTGDGVIKAQDLSCSVSADTEKVSASVSGQIEYPAFLEPFTASGTRMISASDDRTIWHPPSLIWKVRGAKRIISALATS